MGKLTISMAIFNSYVSHYQRVMSGMFWRCRIKMDSGDFIGKTVFKNKK